MRSKQPGPPHRVPRHIEELDTVPRFQTSYIMSFYDNANITSQDSFFWQIHQQNNISKRGKSIVYLLQPPLIRKQCNKTRVICTFVNLPDGAYL
jgi:hypothetical protein